MSIICLNLSPAFELVYSVADFADEVTTADVFGIVPGGKGLNVAAMLTAKGVNVKIVTPAFLGPFASAYLSGISNVLPLTSVHFVDQVKVPLRFSTVVVNRDDPFRTLVLRTTFEPDAAIINRNLEALLTTIEPVIRQSQVVVMAGSPGVFGVDAYSRIVALANRNDCRTYVDTSGASLDRVLMGEPPSVIKVNRSEADRFPLLQKYSTKRRRGLIVVTDGPRAV